MKRTGVKRVLKQIMYLWDEFGHLLANKELYHYETQVAFWSSDAVCSIKEAVDYFKKGFRLLEECAESLVDCAVVEVYEDQVHYLMTLFDKFEEDCSGYYIRNGKLVTTRERKKRTILTQGKEKIVEQKLKTQEKFKILDKYCVSDVEAEYAISKKLGELPSRELDIWLLDQKINEYGVPIDIEAVKSAINLFKYYESKLLEELADITDGQITSINAVAKILNWCESYDEYIPSLTKETVEQYLTKVINPKVKRVLEIRQLLGKSSVKKYKAMLASTDEDDSCIRDTLKYYGASTGRWTGKLVQFQNLPRGSISDMDTAINNLKNKTSEELAVELGNNVSEFLVSAIRGMIRAKPNHKLLVADFSSVETRVLAWLSGDDKMQKAYVTGRDLYKNMASAIYRIPIDKITSEQRQLGKAVILGAGYGMGHKKFLQTCNNWGIDIDEQLAQTAVNTYRLTYRSVKGYWAEQQKAAYYAVLNPDKKAITEFTTYFLQADFLKCKLPSGRTLHYYKPDFKTKKADWGESNELTYLAEKNGKYIRVGTYGGKLVENIVQAVARDLMADAMLRLDKAGYNIILTIHDEIIAEVPEKDITLTLRNFCSIMGEIPKWARDCTIEVEGWEGKHYKK